MAAGDIRLLLLDLVSESRDDAVRDDADRIGDARCIGAYGDVIRISGVAGLRIIFPDEPDDGGIDRNEEEIRQEWGCWGSLGESSSVEAELGDTLDRCRIRLEIGEHVLELLLRHIHEEVLDIEIDDDALAYVSLCISLQREVSPESGDVLRQRCLRESLQEALLNLLERIIGAIDLPGGPVFLGNGEGGIAQIRSIVFQDVSEGGS